jgi:hypothetical protein
MRYLNLLRKNRNFGFMKNKKNNHKFGGANSHRRFNLQGIWICKQKDKWLQKI